MLIIIYNDQSMFLRIILLFLLVVGCTNSTGFKGEPKGNDPKKIGIKQRGVTLKFYDLNKINTASLPKFEDIQKKQDKKLTQLISENKYYYSIGAGDVINISITDIDDIDGS
ncbi:MAG: hypothetical protein HON33_00495, partial [Flavobacteriaceae bacterium]|nr:hypothetical protein [Flavobacteriaceae bacterium]